MSEQATHYAVTINGSLGSGKSRVARQLSSELDVEYVYTGAIQRQIAERLGMNTRELNEYSETHSEIDDEIDSVFKSLRHAEYDVVVDSRMAWHFLPQAFKVHLTVAIEEGARRIMNDTGRVSEHYDNLRHAIQEMRARKASEHRRFEELYGVHSAQLSNYNLVIDTTYANPDQVTQQLMTQFLGWQKAPFAHRHVVSPQLIRPPTKSSDAQAFLALSDKSKAGFAVRALDNGEFVALQPLSKMRVESDFVSIHCVAGCD